MRCSIPHKSVCVVSIGSCLERAAIGFKTSRSDESRVKIPSHETSHVQTACIDSALAPNATVTARPCQCEPLQHPTPAPKPHTGNNTHPTPPERTIFFITPTYARSTQKSDLTSVCVTLMHVQKVVWIIVEDSEEKSDLVKRLLNRCTVTSVHLNAVTPKYYKTNKWKPRGVLQRNAGLTWVRNHHTAENCTGIVYFGDDDNSYDLKIFIKVCEASALKLSLCIVYVLGLHMHTLTQCSTTDSPSLSHFKHTCISILKNHS